jgi:hypothetical protein
VLGVDARPRRRDDRERRGQGRQERRGLRPRRLVCGSRDGSR